LYRQQQKITLLLSPISAGYPEENSQGGAMESSRKQNPEIEFPSPSTNIVTDGWIL
jgi:hypothetical protein